MATLMTEDGDERLRVWSTPPSPWVESLIGAANAVVTVTHAATAGIAHSITDIVHGFDSAVLGVTLTVKSGTTTLAAILVGGGGQISLDTPITCAVGESAVVSIAAAGVGIAGSLLVTGYSTSS